MSYASVHPHLKQQSELNVMRISVAIQFVVFLAMLPCGQQAAAQDMAVSPSVTCLDFVESQIKILKDTGSVDLASAFEMRADQIRKTIKGELPPVTDGTPQVHVIAAHVEGEMPRLEQEYFAADVDVKIKWTKAPVVLLLMSNYPMKWHLNVDSDTQIKAAVVWDDQEAGSFVGGLPTATLISRERVKFEYFGVNLSRFARLPLHWQDQIEAATGLPVTTIQHITNKEKAVTIGPESSAWRRSYVHQDAIALLADVFATQNEVALRSFSELRFRARYDVAIPQLNRGTHWQQAYSAEFSLLGPDRLSMTKQDDDVFTTVSIPRENHAVGLGSQYLTIIREGKKEEWSLRGVIAEKFFTGLAYDSARHRLFLVGTNEDGASRLYQCELGTGEWSECASDKSTVFAIMYDAQSDRILGLRQAPLPKDPKPPEPAAPPRSREEALERARGQRFPVVSARPLLSNDRLSPVELVEWKDDAAFQSVSPLKLPYVIDTKNAVSYQLIRIDDGHIVIVSPPVRKPRAHYESCCTLVEVPSGRILYHGVARPHDGVGAAMFEGASAASQGTGELVKLWRQQDRTANAIEHASAGNADRGKELQQQFETVNGQLHDELNHRRLPRVTIGTVTEDLAQLERDALNGEIPAVLADLADARFSAVFTADSPESDGALQSDPNLASSSVPSKYFADATLRGVIRSSIRPIHELDVVTIRDPIEPDNLIGLAYGKILRRLFSDGNHGYIPDGSDVLKIGTAMAYDSKRNRLLVTLGERCGDVDAYDFSTREWSVLTPVWPPCLSLTYAAEEDVFYGISWESRGRHIAAIRCISPLGEQLRMARVTPPIDVSIRDSREHPPQVRYVDRYLIIICPKSTDGTGDQFLLDEGLQTPWIHVVDVETGELVHEHRVLPQDPARKP